MKSLAGLEAPSLRALGLRAPGPGCNGTVRAVARRGGGAETDNKALQAKL